MTRRSSLASRWSSWGTPLARKGLVLVVVMTLLLLGLGFKSQIKNRIKPGETIQAEFAQNYNLKPYISKVKVAGLQVGVVTGIDETDSGTALVSMKVDDSAVETLGDQPSARIAPLTILGGQYGVELLRGGNGDFDGDTIPTEQTSTPVELDLILAALPADTRTAAQGLLRNTNRTLDAGGTDGLRALLTKAPDVLPTAGTFLEAAQGQRPSQDLPSIVTNLQSLAQTLVERRDLMDQNLIDFDTTTATLAAQSSALTRTIDGLPETLDATDRGVDRLDGTLTRLEESTTKLRPSIRALKPLIDELAPTLSEALPTVVKLPPIVRDAEEIVRQLVPTVPFATSIVDDVRGPVIDRVDGPILDYLANTWHGKADGPYKNSGGGYQADNKMYEELAYMIVNLGRSSMTQDPQGTLLNFQAGAGTSTVQPLAFDEALAALIPQLTGGPR